MMRRIVLSLLAAAGLSGCAQTFEEMRVADLQNSGLCPNIFALSDAARLIQFDGDASLENVAWSAEILDVRTTCRYVEDRPIEALVEIDLAVGRGPAATSDTYNLPYFVAVTRTNRAVIAKEQYAIPVKVRNGLATVRLTERIDEIIIPRRDEDISGVNFEIAVGLSLTRDQILFNRSGQSLKFPSL